MLYKRHWGCLPEKLLPLLPDHDNQKWCENVSVFIQSNIQTSIHLEKTDMSCMPVQVTPVSM